MDNSRFRFRAWNGSAMEYGGFSIHSSAGRLMPLPGLSGLKQNSPVMQYTGLKDKNGTEIYELMEIDGKFRVIFSGCSYVLQDIPTGDIVMLLDNPLVRAHEREITGEYSPV